jgi:RNA polymerase sigma-70 factor, ECF subfamily
VKGTSPHDAELVALAIARVKEGDTGALHLLYVCYADDVQGYVNSIVRDHHEAEDITHTVFAELMAAIQHYEQRSVPFAAWIHRVARNAAVDSLRVRRPVPWDGVRASHEVDDQLGYERLQCLRQALVQLPADQREVLILRHIAGLSPGEIARLLHRSESSIHGLHHRGRAAMQKTLRDLEAAPMTAAG